MENGDTPKFRHRFGQYIFSPIAGRETHKWCEEQFGPAGLRYIVVNEVIFMFQDDNDAFAFRMRWC